jgi:hypothetical protein
LIEDLSGIKALRPDVQHNKPFIFITNGGEGEGSVLTPLEGRDIEMERYPALRAQGLFAGLV